MQHTSCDICGLLIKDSEIKHMFYQQDVLNNQVHKDTEVKALCSTCIKIYNHLFNIRKGEQQKILLEIEKSYTTPEIKIKHSIPKANKMSDYCQCEEFLDAGIIIDGKADGICYICGKLEKPLTEKELEKLMGEYEGE